MRRVAAVAAAGALLVGGCGTSTDDMSEPALTGPVRTITKAEQFRLPIARYVPSLADERLVGEAVEVLTARCATRFGVRINGSIIGELPGLLEGSERRYGLLDPAEAKALGYERPRRPSFEEWDPSPREQEVVAGMTSTGAPAGPPVPKGGCASASWRTIQGQGAAMTGLVDEILGESWDATARDSRAVRVQTAWSRCMAGRGHDFTHRWDAGDSVASVPPAQQIPVATDDVACARETNYIGVWHAVDAAYQELLITEHEADLTRARAAQEAAVARAEKTCRQALDNASEDPCSDA